MPYLRKRGTDDVFVSTPNLAARDDMLPMTDEQAEAVMKGNLSLKGTDFSQTTSEDGKRIVTKYLRKRGTNELFAYTDMLAERRDMIPTTEAQAENIKNGTIDYVKLENVVVDTTKPLQPNPDDDIRIDMTDTLRGPLPAESTPPAPRGAGTATAPPENPIVDARAGVKNQQIDKLSTMSKDEMMTFAKEKFQVNIDKRKNEETVREIVTLLIQDNP